MKKSNYEVVFVLVNQGFTGVIMDVARAKGVRGGTIVNARGGANEEAEKNYGIAITPNKELVLMLVDSKIKKSVIDAVYTVAGIETKGEGIIWSVPADNIVGIKMPQAKVKKTKKVSKK